jgi:hypothetical protein
VTLTVDVTVQLSRPRLSSVEDALTAWCADVLGRKLPVERYTASGAAHMPPAFAARLRAEVLSVLAEYGHELVGTLHVQYDPDTSRVRIYT